MRNCDSPIVFCFLQWAAGMYIREGTNSGLLHVKREGFDMAKSPQMATQGGVPSLYDISQWLMKRGFISRGAFGVRAIPDEKQQSFSAVLCGYCICQSHIPIGTHGTSLLRCPGLLAIYLSGLSPCDCQWHSGSDSV